MSSQTWFECSLHLVVINSAHTSLVRDTCCRGHVIGLNTTLNLPQLCSHTRFLREYCIIANKNNTLNPFSPYITLEESYTMICTDNCTIMTSKCTKGSPWTLNSSLHNGVTWFLVWDRTLELIIFWYVSWDRSILWLGAGSDRQSLWYGNHHNNIHLTDRQDPQRHLQELQGKGHKTLVSMYYRYLFFPKLTVASVLWQLTDLLLLWFRCIAHDD